MTESFNRTAATLPQTPELRKLGPGDAARQDKMDVEAVVLLSVFQDIYVLGIQAQAGILPFEPTEEVLEQPLGILHRCGKVSIIKGQCGEQVGRGEIGVEQPPQPPLCVPLIEPLLYLRCRHAPLPSFLWMGIYWIDSHLQILPTVVFLLSVSSLHICSLSYMVIVLIPYTSPPYGTAIHPVGKSYASKVDDEKSAFWKRNKYPTAQA